jgi:hypothetical protein
MKHSQTVYQNNIISTGVLRSYASKRIVRGSFVSIPIVNISSLLLHIQRYLLRFAFLSVIWWVKVP